MKHIYLFALLSLLNGTLMVSQEIDLTRLEAVADSIANLQQNKGISEGISVGIAVDGKVVLNRSYGKADVEMGVEVTPQTVFRIGSLTKQFTAAAIMQLVEAGKISLDKPISEYLPNYNFQGRHLTVRHLLNHTSGINIKKIEKPDDYLKLLLRPEFDLSNEKLLELLTDGPFKFEPGEQYAYSNLGYMLLGNIISNVTGMPYAEYIEQKLVKPLGLENTLYCDVLRIIPNRAEGYSPKDGKILNAPYISMVTPGAAGGLCSTVGDLLKWNFLLQSGKVVLNASLEEMTKATILTNGKTNDYGYGLKLGKIGDHPKIFHGGSISGFQSALYYYPKAGLTIAVLMNSEQGDPEQMEEALARSAFDMEILDISLSPEEMAGYEGTYALKNEEQDLELRVFREEGQLKAEIVGEGVTPLLYQGNNTFVAAFDPEIKLVLKKQNGKANNATFHAFGKVFKGERKLQQK